jgi:hypothetical protein
MKQSTYYYLLRRGVIGGGGGPGPTNTVPPVISGTAERGETLTSTTGTWTGTGTITFAYQWTRNGADISGATSSTYTLVADDDNADMVCKITATDDEGSRVKKSNTLGPVLGIPTALVDPVASGTPEVDEVLSVTDGTWQGLQPITITYQWRRDTVDISGATSNTYTLVSADLNALVDCMVTATNSIRSTSVDSNDLGPIEAAPVVPTVPVISGVPTIAGTAKVGETLTATAASATGEPTPTTSWQWERSDNGTSGWASISGATSSTYTAVSADESKYLRVVQTETNTEGSDSANSAATAQVAAATDADYQAVLDRASTLGYTAPSSAQQTLQNTLVEDLKDAGVWSKLDVFYVFATDGDSDYATLNWKSPSSFQITKTNSPTFTTNEGFAQSGTAYLDTGFILDTNGTNYTQDNAGVFVAFPTLSSTTGSNNRALGGDSGNYLSARLDANGSNSSNRMWMNSSSYKTFTLNKKDDTIFFANRTASNAIDIRSTDLALASTDTASDTAASSSLTSENFVILKARATDYFETSANFGMVALGSSLTAAEMADVEEAWYTNYFTSL